MADLVRGMGWVSEKAFTAAMGQELVAPECAVDFLACHVGGPLEMRHLGVGILDLRPWCSEIVDQLGTSSCVGQSKKAMFECLDRIDIAREIADGRPGRDPLYASALSAYYNSRFTEGRGTVRDTGTTIWHCAQTVVDVGMAEEADWPFREDAVNTKPDWAAQRAGYKHRFAAWSRISATGEEKIRQMDQFLNMGMPFEFGTYVGRSFSATKSLKPLTYKPNDPDGGGHSMLGVGWTLDGDLIVRNHWGTSFGDRGYCVIAREWAAHNTEDVSAARTWT